MDFNVYIFVLTMVVFVAVGLSFSVLIAKDVINTVKATKLGLNDREIEKTRRDEMAKQKHPVLCFFTDKVIPVILVLIVVSALIFSVIIRTNEKNNVSNDFSLKVVESGSMSYKNENNGYLKENDLNDQIMQYDLIVVSALPKESELKVYDIVVYEKNG